MNLDELLNFARKRKFKDPAMIKALARPAVELLPTPDLAPQSTKSRLGGLPGVPGSFTWPKWNGSSMSFVAQIDLSSQPGVLACEEFPADGTLLFFYDVKQSTWGFDPKNAGSFAVIYVPASTPIAPVSDWPEDIPGEARFPACALSSRETITLQPWDSIVMEDLRLNRGQLEAYHDVIEFVSGDDPWLSRGLIGGYPDQIQGDMTIECALVSAGLYCGDGSAYLDPRLPQFRQQSREWRLLLQVPSAESAGMMWGDVGCLYYWIREDDLAARRFDRCWMILQCG